jgi:hypothetical protein
LMLVPFTRVDVGVGGSGGGGGGGSRGGASGAFTRGGGEGSSGGGAGGGGALTLLYPRPPCETTECCCLSPSTHWKIGSLSRLSKGSKMFEVVVMPPTGSTGEEVAERQGRRGRS